MEMQIDETRLEGAVVVAPVGRIDSTTSSALDAHLLGLAKAGQHRVVIDFSGVDYISSAGLRVMLTLAKRTKEARGKLALAALGDSVRQVFELAGFLPLFSVEANAAEATARVSAP
jgi:anti-anti-sigma factor